MNRILLDMLRRGGYILYARHGEATVGTDRPKPDFRFCDTQRNLSSRGRAQAAVYGNLLRQCEIPVETPVLSSPYCRAIETAQLAFPGAGVMIDPFWAQINDLGSMMPSQQARVLFALRTKLETMPVSGFNQPMIAHGFPDDVGFGYIPNMGTVVVRPLGVANGFEIAARFTLEDLAAQ